MKKIHYVLYLRPPRPSFAADMTGEERAIMLQHVAYWKDLLEKDLVLAYGPVMDPEGVYGLGIVEVATEEEMLDLIAHDPANGLNKYEHFLMRAVVPPR